MPGRALVSMLALTGALACGSSSQAAVHYAFEFTSAYAPGTPISFEYTAPGFIDVNQSFAAAAVDACASYPGTTCGVMEFFPDSGSLISSGDDLFDAIGFNFLQGGGGAGSYHYFADGAFGQAGVHVVANDDGRARLTVTTSVPEPATWAMMLLGFSGLGAALRVRRRGVTRAN
jgi:hypothetical protein